MFCFNSRHLKVFTVECVMVIHVSEIVGCLFVAFIGKSTNQRNVVFLKLVIFKRHFFCIIGLLGFMSDYQVDIALVVDVCAELRCLTQ